jgi:hypothetical protein
VQYLLKNLNVGHQPLAFCDRALEHPLRLYLLRMRCADQLDRDVGVDENHSGRLRGYPLAISESTRAKRFSGAPCPILLGVERR